jgi:hypothetical protein
MNAGRWTVETANAALPRLTETIERAQLLANAIRAGAATQQEVSSNGHGRHQDPTDELTTLLEELEDEEIVLRDVDRGLIDFGAVAPSGRPYWLCWVIGEPAVEWWHWPEDGFAGRTALTDPPA